MTPQGFGRSEEEKGKRTLQLSVFKGKAAEEETGGSQGEA